MFDSQDLQRKIKFARVPDTKSIFYRLVLNNIDLSCKRYLYNLGKKVCYTDVDFDVGSAIVINVTVLNMATINA